MAALRNRLNEARETFQSRLGDVDRSLQSLFAEWDRTIEAAAGAESAEQQKLMARMNEGLNRRSYIRNLVESVEKELAEA
jgi:hypothetical protein